MRDINSRNNSGEQDSPPKITASGPTERIYIQCNTPQANSFLLKDLSAPLLFTRRVLMKLIDVYSHFFKQSGLGES